MTELETSNPATATGALAPPAQPDHAAAPAATASGRVEAASAPGRVGVEADAAFVELRGVSVLTVENYEQSVPPNLATAAALATQLASPGGLSTAERSNVFALMNRSAVLALANA